MSRFLHHPGSRALRVGALALAVACFAAMSQAMPARADDERDGEGTVKERARGQRCGACLIEEVEDAHRGVGVAEDDCRADGEG